MKLNVNDIDELPKRLDFTEPTEILNRDLVHGDVCDFEFEDGVNVQLTYQRTGDDLIFLGRVEGHVVGHCARCLEPYPFDLLSEFSQVMVPRPAVESLQQEDLDPNDDDAISYYEGDEVDLSPVVREQLILALPTKPLCSEECKGLCSQCGANLNEGPCDCRPVGDPRLAALRNLKVQR